MSNPYGEQGNSVSFFTLKKSEMDDFLGSENILRIGKKTLELDGEKDYRQPGILRDGHLAASFLMAVEDNPHPVVAKVEASIPGGIHSWLQTHLLDRSGLSEPRVYGSIEARPIVYSPAP
jgi:hypothetical protein